MSRIIESLNDGFFEWWSCVNETLQVTAWNRIIDKILYVATFDEDFLENSAGLVMYISNYDDSIKGCLMLMETVIDLWVSYLLSSFDYVWGHCINKNYNSRKPPPLLKGSNWMGISNSTFV